VQAAIRALDAPFEVVEIDPEYADTAAFCEQYGYDPAASANAILIASKRPPGVHALCVALATTRLDVNHRVRALMGVKKLSFASPEATKDLTGMMIGGVTPFGVPDDLTIYVDSAVLEPDPIIVGGGDRSTKIILSPTVFTRMPSVEIVPDLAVS
jgi:prolyl-tRNA editing enzyme YbaK/EbsC (Cys-tRNA(Pro) deacylase)